MLSDGDPQYARGGECRKLRRLSGRDLTRLGANTKPIASTWAVAAALTASAVVMPQILIHMVPSVAI